MNDQYGFRVLVIYVIIEVLEIYNFSKWSVRLLIRYYMFFLAEINYVSDNGLSIFCVAYKCQQFWRDGGCIIELVRRMVSYNYISLNAFEECYSVPFPAYISYNWYVTFYCIFTYASLSILLVIWIEILLIQLYEWRYV